MAVQEGPTSIRVSWTPSSDATGYVISYTGGGSSDSVTVSGGSTDNYLLEGLMVDATYTISIAATSQQLPSDAIVVEITLSKKKHSQMHAIYFLPVHVYSSSSRPAQCQCSDLYNSHLHLPLLECSQWLSGDQFRGDVERGQQWY